MKALPGPMVRRLGVKFLSPKALCLGVDSKPLFLLPLLIGLCGLVMMWQAVPNKMRALLLATPLGNISLKSMVFGFSLDLKMNQHSLLVSFVQNRICRNLGFTYLK